MRRPVSTTKCRRSLEGRDPNILQEMIGKKHTHNINYVIPGRNKALFQSQNNTLVCMRNETIHVCE